MAKEEVGEESTAPSFSGKNTDVGKIIELGTNITQLNLSKPVKIIIQGEAGKDVGWTRAGEGFHKIEECSKNFDNATEANKSLENYDECKIDVNNSLVIWTTHFTEFVTYETSSTGGGSSGSGGSIGGTGGCTTEWNCTEWGECVNETQTRTCSYPEGSCEPTEEKPEENRTCELGTGNETEEGLGDEEGLDEISEEKEESTRGFITGFVTGIKEGKTRDLFVLVVIVAVLGLIIYYRSSTIAGLSKRAENLHKKADKLNKKGEHNRSSRVRNKARKFQVRADKKGY